jgi:hypothetical protein
MMLERKTLEIEVNTKEDLKELRCHQNRDTWMKYNGVKHKVIYSDKNMTCTVSKAFGFIIRTHYDTKNFPNIIYEEKQYLDRLENSVEERDKNMQWNLNFYNGTLDL